MENDILDIQFYKLGYLAYGTNSPVHLEDSNGRIIHHGSEDA